MTPTRHSLWRVAIGSAACVLAVLWVVPAVAGEPERIYRSLWKARSDASERHVRCAAILGLARAVGIGAMGDIVEAMKSDDVQIRSAAGDAAVAMPGEDVTKQWIDHLAAVPVEAKPGVVEILERRGGEQALGAVLETMKAKDATVRLAAVGAAKSFPGTRAVVPLVAFLASESRVERDVARRSLERIPGDEAGAAVASALPTVAPPVRRELLGVLAARGARDQTDAILACTKDPDKGVQEEAVKALEPLGGEKHVATLIEMLVTTDSGGVRGAAERSLGAICARSNRDACVAQILPATEKAGVDARCALVRVLQKAPTKKALEAVRAAVKDNDEKIREAGVRALSEWPGREVAPDLLAIAREGASQTQQVLALRGYVRLVKDDRKLSGPEKVAMYKDAMQAAKRAEEKKMVLSALGEVKDIEALKWIAEFLGVDGLKEEAAAAAVRIGREFRGDVRAEPLKTVAIDVMKKVLEVSKNDNVRRDAERVVREAERK